MIILDIEATSLNFLRSSILSIGAISLDNPNEYFYEECKMLPGAEVNPQSLEVNGFTKEQITDESKQTPSELLQHFIAWLKRFPNQTIAGLHVYLDLQYLKTQAIRSKLEFNPGYRIVDLHSVIYGKLLELGQELPIRDSRTDLSFDLTLKFVGINYERKAHNALEDARLEAESFSRILLGKNLLPEYKQYEIPEYLKK